MCVRACVSTTEMYGWIVMKMFGIVLRIFSPLYHRELPVNGR